MNSRFFSVSTCRTIIGIIYLLVLPLSALAQLPQDYQYQKTLYEYLATLNADDFKVETKGLEWDENYFQDTDNLFKTAILLENAGRSAPSSQGFRIDSELFVLNNIERNGKVYMEIEREGRGMIDPIATAWWAHWEYPGNPYFDSKPVKLRAFVAAAVDMMMLDQSHDRGDGDRSDFLGGSLIRLGYTYGVVKDILPSNVRSAYEKGLRKMFKKIEDWGPKGNHADMDMFATVGMWYTAQSLNDDDLKRRAKNYVARLFNKHYKEAGYIDHGGGFDASYQGISFLYSTWAGLLSNNQEIVDAVDQMSKLKSALSFEEPEGGSLSPSHFATANDAGSANDQKDNYYRNLGMAMLTDNAKYLADRSSGWYTPALGSRSELYSFVKDNLLRKTDGGVHPINSALFVNPDIDPKVWSEDHWISDIIFTYDLYKSGFYDQMRDLKAQDSPLLKSKHNREETFTERFGETFLITKQKDFSAAVHSGRLSWWGDEQEITGFGGGALSAFWTPETGSVILGKQKGYQNPEGPDKWKNWRLWPTHALSGETSDGNPFSTARQRYPEAEFNTSQKVPTVEVSGALNDQYAAPDNILNGEVTYSRTFKIRDDGVEIISGIQSEGTNKVNELYEIIPIFLRDERSQDSNVTAKISAQIDGEWRSLDTTPVKTSRLRINRFKGTIYIEFENQRLVKLSDQEWRSSYQTKSRARNILVSVLNENNSTSVLENQSVRYKIYTKNGEGLSENTDDGNGNEEKPETDTTTPKVSISHSPKNPKGTQKLRFEASADDESGIKEIGIYVNGKLEKKCKDAKDCSVKKGPFFSCSAGIDKVSYYAVAVDKADDPNKKKSPQKSVSVSVQSRSANNFRPSVGKPRITESSGTIELEVPKLKDQDGDTVQTNIDWRVDDHSLAMIHFPFDVCTDTSIKDLSTYHNNGQLQGSFKPEWTPLGREAGAYTFDGKDDHIFIPSSEGLETLYEFTLEFWMKHDEWGQDWATIVSKPFFKSKWTDPWSLFKIGRYGNQDQLNFQITVDKGKVMRVRTKSDIPADEWVHVVATYDGKDIKIFINGELENKRQVNAHIVKGRGTGVYIGSKWGGGSNSEDITDMEAFKGEIDEFRLFRRALSHKQIKKQKNYYNQIILPEVTSGQKWTAAVTPTDTKSYGESVISNAVTIQGQEEEEENKPVGLSQNYPNPFRSETEIEYTLPDEETEVSLTVYNILGRKIATLVDNESQEGTKSISFNAPQLGLSSGVYFYQLKMGDKTYSKKMTLIK